jgi:hypothetical protein
VLRSYVAQKGGTRSKGGERGNCKGRQHVQWDEEGARGPCPCEQILIQWGAWKFGFLSFVFIFFGFVKFVKFVFS